MLIFFVNSTNGSKSELTTAKVSYECDDFCYKIQSIDYFQKALTSPLRLQC